MKKFLLIISTIVLASCKKEAAAPAQQPIPQVSRVAVLPENIPELLKEPVPENVKKSTATKPLIISKTSHKIKDSLQLARLLQRLEDTSQTFTVPATKITTVTGKGGTIVTVNPNDLATADGTSVTGIITVELKELLDTKSLLKNNPQTMSGDKLLVSGGSYYIGMTSDGNELQLKSGKTLDVQFTKLTDDRMELFYGDNTNGQMNWQKADVGFENKIYGEALATEEFEADNIAFASTGTVNSTRISQNLFAQRDTINGIPANLDTTKAEKEVTKKVYKTMQINKLGWINCDRFYNKPVTNVQYAVTGKDTISAITFLVFKDINSVVSGYYNSGINKILNMPVNRKATFIMIAAKDEKTYAYSKDIIIQPGIFIKPELKEISENEVAQLFGKQ